MKSNIASTKPMPKGGLSAPFELLLQKMQQVQSMVFESKSQSGSVMGWGGRAEARVTAQITTQTTAQEEKSVQKRMDDSESIVLKLHERGFFYPNKSTKPLPFSNCFKLVFKQDQVEFHHERFGVAHGIWLFNLIVDDDETSFVSQQSHACGQDHYHVKVRVVEDGIEMQWQIKGPKKNEWLDYHYSTKQL